MSSPVRLFISYAREDLDHLTTLEKHLSNLKRQGQIEVWTDQKLLTGTEWEPELLEKLKNAQIVLVLMSPDMMASDFIHDVELKETLARHKRGEVHVVPIRVKPTELEGHPLTAFTCLPLGDRPITRCEDRDDAWVQVASAVRELIKSFSPHRPDKESPERRLLSTEYRQTLDRLRALETRAGDPGLIQTLRDQARDLRQRLLEGNIRPEDVIDQRYRILRKLGQGGFASVWLAEDLHQERLVAVKILLSTLMEDQERRERFERGSRAMKQLVHPRILPVVEPYRISQDEPGTSGLRHYVVLEWAEKGDLFQWLKQQRPSEQTLVECCLEVAEGLDFAHARQIIHRDIKPHNILIGKDGCARLTDFDLAKLLNSNLLSQSNMRGGSAFYGAPEVQETRPDGTEPLPVGPAADIYGLGMTLLSLFLRRELTAMDLRRLDRLVEQSVPSVLRPVLLRAIEPEPSHRYQTISEFREALIQVRERLGAIPIAVQEEQRPRSTISLSRTVLPPDDIRQLESDLAKLPLQERLERLRELGRTGDPRIGLDKPWNWIWIEPGEFRMGDDHGWMPEHGPSHPVSIHHGLYITRFPITNQDFAPFWDEGVYRQQRYWSEDGWAEKRGGGPGKTYAEIRSERSNHPVAYVSWWHAEAFAAYLQQNIHLLPPLAHQNDKALAVRLPTEAEWEYVARGEQNQWFPWGQTERFQEHANVQELKLEDTTPVGAFPKCQSSEGVQDLIGNVWEWCFDWHSPYLKEHQVSPRGPNAGEDKILRGGAFDTQSDKLRSFTRSRQWPHKQQKHFGFRLVRSAKA